MKEVSKIEKEWILEIASHYYEDKTNSVISKRQIDELTNNEKIVRKNEIYDKNSISNVIANSENEKFKGSSSLSFSTRKNANRIYMDSDKNKGDDYYFDELEENQLDLNQNKIPKKVVAKEVISVSNQNKEDEELDNITLLRRMRNRVNK